ncbi:helix-turn-helix domain-containing protein [Salmonella enterica]|nr:helix-turn-helix domain-containing protein [Salmonella enterica]ELZ2409234.1 helix-turn-helix domain-containing protein [Salmonella enterica]
MMARTFGERLLARRNELGLSQDDLAKKTGVSRVTISKIELGDSQDTRSSNLFRIAEALKCSPRWLLDGTEEESAVVDKNVTNPKINHPTSYRYPKLTWVSAGPWNCEDYPCYPDDWIGSDVNAGENGFWLDVRGDSMTSPGDFSIFEGMEILVSPEQEVHPGKYVVARLRDSGEATLKQYVEDAGQRFLKPLNPRYPMIPINGNCEIVGVVVEMRMKI